MTHDIAIIGAGNMARALVGGLIDRGHRRESITAADPDEAARGSMHSTFGIRVSPDNEAAVDGADVVILAVKPQVIETVAAAIGGALSPGCVVVSVAAGVPIAALGNAFGHRRPGLIRVMPNTPALKGVGATGLYADPECSEEQRARVRGIFQAVGRVFEIADESLMDVVTAVSGSGPAYFFALTEALARAGTEAGLAPDVAEGLAAQTAAGAGAMLRDNEVGAAELRRRVTSPGGTTEAGLDALDRNNLDHVVASAVAAAIRRGRELARREPE
jgi:pyrroline-5-carboxylate reductase